MKLISAIILCLFFGVAFSQDSTSVELLPPIIELDTIAPDTLNLDTSSVDSVKINPGLHFFASIGAQFVNFSERSKFQTFLDEQLDSGVLRQDFQTVNLAFPITAGILWQFNDMHSLGLGAGFLYSNESVISTDSLGETRNFEYTLQAFPVFVEYRLQISPNLISLKEGDYFSLFLRYYWMLPHTEIYSSWGNAKADFDPLGSGFGVFLGYRFWEWEGLSVWGEMGYSSIEVKSGDKNAVLDSWNLGGVSLLIRAMF